MSRTLLEQWKDIAYDETADRGQLQNFWEAISRLRRRFMKSFFLIRMKKSEEL